MFIYNLQSQIFMSIFPPTYDKLYWVLIPNGIFSMKSMYNSIKNLRNQITPNPLYSYKWIWKLHIPPKISFFLWLIYHDRLPTTVYLTRAGILNSSLCPQYHTAPETLKYLFLECPNAITLWNILKVSSTNHNSLFFILNLVI